MNMQPELIKEVATRINSMVNIPLINEQNEQMFFEFLVGLLLGMFLEELDKDRFGKK